MAELKDILEVNDFSQVAITPDNLPVKPTRVQIEAALVLNGVTVPPTQSVSFVLFSATRVHTVRYGITPDAYFTLNMETAA